MKQLDRRAQEAAISAARAEIANHRYPLAERLLRDVLGYREARCTILKIEADEARSHGEDNIAARLERMEGYL